jgi:hypothetical protein
VIRARGGEGGRVQSGGSNGSSRGEVWLIKAKGKWEV